MIAYDQRKSTKRCEKTKGLLFRLILATARTGQIVNITNPGKWAKFGFHAHINNFKYTIFNNNQKSTRHTTKQESIIQSKKNKSAEIVSEKKTCWYIY